MVYLSELHILDRKLMQCLKICLSTQQLYFRAEQIIVALERKEGRGSGWPKTSIVASLLCFLNTLCSLDAFLASPAYFPSASMRKCKLPKRGKSMNEEETSPPPPARNEELSSPPPPHPTPPLLSSPNRNAFLYSMMRNEARR